MQSTMKPRSARSSFNKLAAAIVWGAAVYTTMLCIERLAPGMVPFSMYAWAFAVQAVLSVLESPVWTGSRQDINIAAVGIDTLINAGGLWPLMQNLDQTPTWAMLADVTGIGQQMGQIPALILAVLVGYLLAKVPEVTWRGA